jgi:hypothetical protein
MPPGEPWVAHDDATRPFDTYTYLCSCTVCELALVREAAARPRLILCLKTNGDRILVTAEYLAETLAARHPAEALCYLRDDWVRAIFVPVNGYLPRPARWWSLTLAEREQREGKPVKRRRKAVRERRAGQGTQRFATVVELDEVRKRRARPTTASGTDLVG